MFLITTKKDKTVKDMYASAKSRNLKLLSNFNAPFWSEYLSNSDRYDKLFRRLYLSYRYFLQDKDEAIDEITDNFIDDVYNHLLVHRKKYEELYRVYTITDEDYSIKDNYRITETMDRDTTSNSDNTYGSRTESNNITNKVVPYDTTVEYEDSATNSVYIKDRQLDNYDNTGTEDYTLTRVGNIGVQTGTDMLDKHIRLCNSYEFYTMIFREICRDLLLVSDSLVD